MGVVLGTLAPPAVLFSRHLWVNWPFWLVFVTRGRSKYIFSAFMMDCFLGGSGPMFRAIPEKLLGEAASSYGFVNPLFGFKDDAMPSTVCKSRPQAALGTA